MPRLTKAQKFAHLDKKIKVFQQFNNPKDKRLKAAQYERQWLQTYQDLDDEDRERHALNKGFDMSIEDELAAKYGLGSSGNVTALKQVYADYDATTTNSDGKRTTVDYKCSLTCHFGSAAVPSLTSSEEQFSISYANENYCLEISEECAQLVISGADRIESPFISFVTSGCPDSEHTTSVAVPQVIQPTVEEHQAEKRRKVEVVDPRKKFIEDYSKKRKAYRFPVFPSKLCASMIILSRTMCSLKVLTRMCHPQLTLVCYCGKASQLSGRSGTFVGEHTEVLVLRRTGNVYHIQVPYQMVGKAIQMIHQQLDLDDCFLKYKVTLAIHHWETTHSARHKR